MPEHQCVQFSIDKVDKYDIVFIIGHIAPHDPIETEDLDKEHNDELKALLTGDFV